MILLAGFPGGYMKVHVQRVPAIEDLDLLPDMGRMPP